MDKKNSAESKKNHLKVQVKRDGPYLVYGGLPLSVEVIVTDKDGVSVDWRKEREISNQQNYALCRCGQSDNMPFCDRSHKIFGFDGSETASLENYLDVAKKISGPGVDLTDAYDLCACARFCGRAGGIWRLVEGSDDPKSKEIAIEEAWNCPSGRLLVWDKETGKSIEPKVEPSISLVEDPKNKVSGPIWLKGGVPIESSNGRRYEVRNLVTLCRCGRSENKPFCDCSHVEAGFDDGYFAGGRKESSDSEK